MTEIEKCVCGGEPVWEADWLSCRECGRESPPGRAAIASWNHDMRGLRLLREVYDLGERQNAALEAAMDDPSDENIDKMTLISDERTALNIQVRAWAEEGDR